jgi:hypothetical protein
MTPVDRICFVAAASAAMLGGAAPPAHAQSAEAEALFRDGRGLIKAGKLAAGCDKLAASEKLESSIGTLLNLGDCREKLGKLASAWAAFRKAEAMAKRSGSDDRREAEAGKRAAQLEPRLANLKIEVADRIDGMVVHRDREVVDEAVWNTALPIDPGSYTITVEAPGYEPWHTTVAVGRGAPRQVVRVPALTRLPPPPQLAQAPAEPSGGEPWPPPTPPVHRAQLIVPEPHTWTGMRIMSAGLAVAGLGALGTGVYFGVHSRNLENDANRICPNAACSDPQGLRFNDQAKTAASRANIFYIAGGAAVATAAVLWFVGAPGEVAIAPQAGDHQLGVAMAGRF